MSCPLIAFSVRIAASGETAVKEAIAREVLGDWNAAQAWRERKAFLFLSPETGEEEPDLLLVLCPVSPRASGVERQLRAGRPALVFFSEARDGFAAGDGEALREFRRHYPAETIVEPFRDEKELRAKLAQQLETLVRYHPHFRTGAEISAVVPEPHPAAPEYSKAAQALLMNACDDPEAYLARRKEGGSVKIQVNGRQFVEEGDPGSAEQWGEAFEELLAAGLIRDAATTGSSSRFRRRASSFSRRWGSIRSAISPSWAGCEFYSGP